MSGFTEKDLPVTIHHGEIVTIGSKSVRFESNGEAKDVFLGESFSADVQLFPSCDHTFEEGGVNYKLTAGFDDTLVVEKA